VQPGQKVLELGCCQGDLLAAMEPAYGVGVDFSPSMVKMARARHPNLIFINADVHEIVIDEQFDVINFSLSYHIAA
jgi:ubiquinone/menaquinone biosynthesis C-methylase UbiE